MQDLQNLLIRANKQKQNDFVHYQNDANPYDCSTLIKQGVLAVMWNRIWMLLIICLRFGCLHELQMGGIFSKEV